MLFSRYGNGAELILNMPFDEGMELLEQARDSKDEEDAYFRWVAGHYDYEISFDEFKRGLNFSSKQQPTTQKTEEEILDKVKKITEMRI